MKSSGCGRPINADISSTEAAYRAIEGSIGKQLDGILSHGRDQILNDAIDARDKGEAWTNAFPTLGATAELTLQRLWEQAKGVGRICLVQPMSETCSSDEKQKEQQQFSAQEDFLTLITAPDMFALGEWRQPDSPKELITPPDLLPFISDSIGKYVKLVYQREFKVDKWTESEFHLIEFDRLFFRMWGCSRLDDIFALIKRAHEVKKVWQEYGTINICGKQFEVLRNPCFCLVLDSASLDPLLPKLKSLDFLYRQVCALRDGDSGKAMTLHRMSPSSLLKRGVAGLEGMVVVRQLTEDVGPAMDFGGEHPYWGGSVWFAWMLTLFQRVATESLAKEVCGLYEKESTETIDTKKYLFEVMQKYLFDVMRMETLWMYREVAKNSDVEQCYQDFQNLYDRENMWQDVREQTETVSSYREDVLARAVNRRSQLFAFMGLPITILLVAFTINVEDVHRWKYISRLFQDNSVWNGLMYLTPLVFGQSEEPSVQILIFAITTGILGLMGLWWRLSVLETLRMSKLSRDWSIWAFGIPFIMAFWVVIAYLFHIPILTSS